MYTYKRKWLNMWISRLERLGIGGTRAAAFFIYSFLVLTSQILHTRQATTENVSLLIHNTQREKERGKGGRRGKKEKKNKFHNGVLINTYNSNVLHALTGKPIERECVCDDSKRGASLSLCVCIIRWEPGENSIREREKMFQSGPTRQTVERTRRSEGSYDDDERILIKLFLLQHAASS